MTTSTPPVTLARASKVRRRMSSSLSWRGPEWSAVSLLSLGATAPSTAGTNVPSRTPLVTGRGAESPYRVRRPRAVYVYDASAPVVFANDGYPITTGVDLETMKAKAEAALRVSVVEASGAA